MSRNVRLYPWFSFFRNLIFWQGVWFLFFQEQLSASEAILLYALYDIATTVLEVPSGYLSDRIGRRPTLILSMLVTLIGSGLLVLGGGFPVYAAAQICLGAGMAFASGTDSALLYESLEREGRGNEVASHEMRAWRASFSALALSALTGGIMSAYDAILPFIVSAAAAAIAFGMAFRFREPQSVDQTTRSRETAFTAITGALSKPVLTWCFVLALSMYVFSHVPFVFGQPFILDALSTYGLAADAPVVSGTVTAAMMLISVAATWGAPWMRETFGFAGTMLAALALQIVLIIALAISAHLAIVALLMLRMVPDSIAWPFLVARIQPLLGDAQRATYLSLQSFCGRLILAVSLIALSSDASEGSPLAHAEMQGILLWYVAAGCVVFVGLFVSARAARLPEDERSCT